MPYFVKKTCFLKQKFLLIAIQMQVLSVKNAPHHFDHSGFFLSATENHYLNFLCKKTQFCWNGTTHDMCNWLLYNLFYACERSVSKKCFLFILYFAQHTFCNGLILKYKQVQQNCACFVSHLLVTYCIMVVVSQINNNCSCIQIFETKKQQN